MAYGTGTITSATPAKDLMAALNPLLTANGFTLVETFQTTAGTGNPTADVYKSAAAGNVFGSDWYFILKRISDSDLNVYYQVAEAYNSGTHRITSYGGMGTSTTPVAVTYAHPGAAVAPDGASGAAVASQARLLLTTTIYSYWYSINANRVIVGVKTGTENGVYLGLYDDLLPTGVTQFPLVAAKFPSTITSSGSIGSAAATNTGGFTREPLQGLANTANFDAAIHNSWWTAPLSAAAANNFTPSTSSAALYGNANNLSRVMLGSARSASTADALRGLLKDCVSSQVASVAGDTITAGGKTYTRFAGPTSTYGIFVDQSA